MRKSVDIVKHQADDAEVTSRRASPRLASTAAADEEVLELVHAVMHRYRAQQYRALRDGPHEITHMDSKVLGFFGRRPGATQSDLAQHSGRDKAQLARLVKGLRDRGLLACEADAADRRNVRLSLTAEGEALQHELRLQARRLATRALAGLSAAETAQLRGLLQRVGANLDVDTPLPALRGGDVQAAAGRREVRR